VGDVKKTDLPGPEALFIPGKQEGQVIMVKQMDGSVEAHQVCKIPTVRPFSFSGKSGRSPPEAGPRLARL
jgi:hypothetical protein